ncbi:hypothetical protein GCM10009678_49250 [Actinomadura kijaniata]
MPVAVADTWYRAPGVSVQDDRQVRLSGDSEPGTSAPRLRTVTWLSVPPFAVTVTPLSGGASVVAFAGLIDTEGAPSFPPWTVSSPPPEEQAAASPRTGTSTSTSTVVPRRTVFPCLVKKIQG